MPVLKAKDLAATFLRKMEAEARPKHHTYYLFSVEGRTVLTTKLSHSARDVSANIVAQIAKQLKISVQELVDYCACTRSSDDWKAHLEQLAATETRRSLGG